MTKIEIEKNGHRYNWLGIEPEIPEESISETITSGAIVIGAGTGGLYAAASLAEKGIKVIVLEKNAAGAPVKNDFGCIGSKYQKAGGVLLDKRALIHYHLIYCSHHLDQRLSRIWAEESGAAVDWIGGLVEANGDIFEHEGGYMPDYADPTVHPQFPVGHSAQFPNGGSTTQILLGHIKDLGGELRYKTPFVKFEYAGKDVTAVIAQDRNTGRYIRFIGKKGIVLSTGGYQHNRVMMQELQPDTCSVTVPVKDGGTSGDGIKACLWMGASMDDVHSSMLFDRAGLFPNELPSTAEPMPINSAGSFWIGSQPWLKVNLKGERFMNESCPYDFASHAAASQPGHCYCSIMDSNWFEHVKRFETVGCSRIYPFSNGAAPGSRLWGLTIEQCGQRYQEINDALVEKGVMQKADTFEDLADKLHIPRETFAATAKRYNALCAKGDDEDFFKEPYRMLALDTPPYYGIRNASNVLCTMDGIRIDTKMRPIDEEGNPFQGLYLTGDCSGSFFAYSYPNLFTGFANGRTLTFARRIACIMNGEEVKEYTAISG